MRNISVGPNKCWLDAMTRGISEWIKDPVAFEKKAQENYIKQWANVSVNTEGHYEVDEYGASKWKINK